MEKQRGQIAKITHTDWSDMRKETSRIPEQDHAGGLSQLGKSAAVRSTPHLPERPPVGAEERGRDTSPPLLQGATSHSQLGANQVMSAGQVTVLIDEASRKGGVQPRKMLFREKLPGGKVLSTHNPDLGRVWPSMASEAGQ